MKFIFNPKIELTAQEVETLNNFLRAVIDACDNAKCDGCILHTLCDECANVPDYLTDLFDTLGIL